MIREKITLVKDTIDSNDINILIEWLKTYPRLTKGPMTIEFEKKWSNWLGCKYSVFVNSGSSANLLMLYTLKLLKQLRNNKIVVPSLAWATDLAPVIQFGFEPIICDCNLDNLSVDLFDLEQIFRKEKPAALILVSVLGLSPDMDKIVQLCKKYGVELLEDNCESQGTKFNNVKLGNFGIMSSFSTYFGHLMSTIEGGMICTNDEEVYNMLIMLRSHGWDRDLNNNAQQKLREKYGIDDFSALYTFYQPGFNVRSTDLQAVIGINQLEKVDEMIRKRNENFHIFKKLLSDKVWFPKETEGSYTASFCIPIITDSYYKKEKLIKLLVENNVECRPLICGSMGTQPFYVDRYGRDDKKNAGLIDAYGIYVPNHPQLTEEEINFMCKLILDAIY